jgi:hypothetical protein
MIFVEVYDSSFLFRCMTDMELVPNQGRWECLGLNGHRGFWGWWRLAGQAGLRFLGVGAGFEFLGLGPCCFWPSANSGSLGGLGC